MSIRHRSRFEYQSDKEKSFSFEWMNISMKETATIFISWSISTRIHLIRRMVLVIKQIKQTKDNDQSFFNVHRWLRSLLFEHVLIRYEEEIRLIRRRSDWKIDLWNVLSVKERERSFLHWCSNQAMSMNIYCQTKKRFPRKSLQTKHWSIFHLHRQWLMDNPTDGNCLIEANIWHDDGINAFTDPELNQ